MKAEMNNEERELVFQIMTEAVDAATQHVIAAHPDADDFRDINENTINQILRLAILASVKVFDVGDLPGGVDPASCPVEQVEDQMTDEMLAKAIDILKGKLDGTKISRRKA